MKGNESAIKAEAQKKLRRLHCREAKTPSDACPRRFQI